MTEFDYQWKNLPSVLIEYNKNRVTEFLRFTGFDKDFLKGKSVLDAGCGNGRYTYAMQQLGATVDSIDVSQEAVSACKEINPKARILSVFDIDRTGYDFILCWGVLHHTERPREGFDILTDALRSGGRLHIMVYNKSGQNTYIKLRKTFALLNEAGKLRLCRKYAKDESAIHGWYDALNPAYNYAYSVKDIVDWYKDDYVDVVITGTSNININGEKL